MCLAHGWILQADGFDLVRLGAHCDGMMVGERDAADWFLHEVRLRGRGHFAGDLQLYVATLACPLVETQDHCVLVLCLLEGGDDDVLCGNLQERMLRRKRAFV